MDAIPVILLLLVLAIGAVLWLNRPLRHAVAADLPDGFPPDGFDHGVFENLLQRFVAADGRIDYEAWLASDDALAALDRYLAAVARFSPDATPRRFPTPNDEMAYWLNAYNAWVIRAVLLHWPLDSVTDVRAPLELVRGLGFFYRLRFPFGGRYLSLHAVENRRIRRRFGEPRIHFILNCASEGCPVARPDVVRADRMGRSLAEATAAFVNDGKNVQVDHARERIVLSRIFRWYRKDFGDDLVTFLLGAAEQPLRGDLERARDYALEFRDYDWRINASD